jgi:hypothetical protein
MLALRGNRAGNEGVLPRNEHSSHPSLCGGGRSLARCTLARMRARCKNTRMNENPPDPMVEEILSSSTDPESPGNGKPFWKKWHVMLPLWIAIVTLVAIALHYGVDKRVIGAGVVLIGLLSNAFAWLLGIIAVVPIAGPLIVKVLALPFIWLLNAVGYFVSYVAIRRGYSKDVLTYRGLTVALIVGIVIGYIFGKLV